MSEALSIFLAGFEKHAAAIMDPYVVVDHQKNIVSFNRPFFALLPRSVARGLQKKKLPEIMDFDFGEEGNIVDVCWQERQNLRFDEIAGIIIDDPAQRELRFILSASPIFDEDNNRVGAVLFLRNVTAQAEMQSRYQELVDAEAKEREQLQAQIRARSHELLETNQLLLSTQRELLDFKRGLLL